MRISLAGPATSEASETISFLSRMEAAKASGYRLILFIILLACSFAIVFMGANYARLFPTNGNLTYAIVTSALFLGVAMVCRYSGKLVRYAPIAYAFFIACVINLVSILFAPYTENILRWLGAVDDMNVLQGIDKVYDMLLVVIPVFALTLLWGENLGSLLLCKGNIHYRWGWGIGVLILVNYFTSVLMFYGTTYTLPALGSATAWGLVFAFANSMLEELWIRGIFFKKLLPLVGGVGTVLLTSTVFGLLHFHSTTFMPAYAVPIFVLNTFTLGLGLGLLTLKTKSLWGAILMHAAADLFMYIAMLAPR